jgi:REP element-mobilizing transposase RayT
VDDTQRPKFRYDRGYLPHYDGGPIMQFVTFRLADSLPQKVIDRYGLELERKLINEIEYHRKVDRFLDEGNGAVHLKNEAIARCIGETLHKFHGEKYKLYSWVIMPNHVHVLFTPNDGYTLAEIMHSIKSFTAKYANRVLGRSGRFWSPEYFDRYIRDRAHFDKTIAYIENNPVKAGLCESPEQWEFGSAWHRMRGR